MITSRSEIQSFSYYLPSLFLALSQIAGLKHLLKFRGVQLLAKAIGGGHAASSYIRGMDQTEGPTEVEVLSGACTLIRASTFTALGGFDERIFLYMEDTDLFFRMKAAKYRSALVPELGVRHHVGMSFHATYTAISPAKHWSTLYYFNKHHGWYSYSVVRAALLLSTLFKACVHIRQRKYVKDCLHVITICIRGPNKWSPFPQP